jgi:hypothetical protein
MTDSANQHLGAPSIPACADYRHAGRRGATKAAWGYLFLRIRSTPASICMAASFRLLLPSADGVLVSLLEMLRLSRAPMRTVFWEGEAAAQLGFAASDARWESRLLGFAPRASPPAKGNLLKCACCRTSPVRKKATWTVAASRRYPLAPPGSYERTSRPRGAPSSTVSANGCDLIHCGAANSPRKGPESDECRTPVVLDHWLCRRPSMR